MQSLPIFCGSETPCVGVCFGLRWEVCSKRLAIDPPSTPPEYRPRTVWLLGNPEGCPILGGHFCRKKAPAASWLAATGLVKSRDGHLCRKKAPAASWIPATGLVKSWVVIFTKQKNAHGKLDSGNRACQISGWQTRRGRGRRFRGSAGSMICVPFCALLV